MFVFYIIHFPLIQNSILVGIILPINSPLQQPKLETTENESGIETAVSEYVEGDIPMSNHDAYTTQQYIDTPTDKAEMNDSHFSTSSASVTTSQTSAEEPASPLPKENGDNIAANEDVIHFTAPVHVQPSDSD